MKTLLFSITLLLFTMISFSQNTAPTKKYYLKKNKNQKTTGWVMLGGGVAMTTVGLLIADKKLNDDPYGGFGYILSNESIAPTILSFVGIGTAIGSIPFFISAGKNSRRAAAISFIHQKLLVPL